MQPSSEILLKVSRLQVELDRSVILQDLSFELQAGQTLVILGPNGAGKTVLLRTLLGLLPHQGEIYWKPGIRIGYVPQRVTLSKDLPLTVEDFLGLKGIAPRQVPELLSHVGIHEATFPKKQLSLTSSGQFQRVLIAWALYRSPEVLLFDEPTAGVDIGGEETIHDLLQKTQRERSLSVILVTHDLATVYRKATHVLCINKKAFCYGPPRDVLDPALLEQVYGKQIRFFGHTHG